MAVGTSGTCAGTEYCVRSNLVAPAGGFDDAVVAGNVKVDISGEYTGATINTAGYTWILAKYNQDSAGSLVWYLDGSVSSVTLPLLFNGKGLSHYTLFNPGPGCCQQVPEPGTLGLLGIGLLGLGFARRRKTA